MRTTLCEMPIHRHSCPSGTWVAHRVERPQRLSIEDRACLLDHLSPFERSRFETIRHPGRAESFLVGRGLTRIALGSALGVPAEQVRIQLGEHAKPRVAHSEGNAVHFNISHSGRCVIVALSRGCEVGIDLEIPRAFDERILPRVLTPSELQGLGDLPPGAAQRAFWSLWTVKEACLKARGWPSAGRWDRVPVSTGGTGRWGAVRWTRVENDSFVAAVAVRLETRAHRGSADFPVAGSG